MNKEERLLKQRERRKLNNNADVKKYEKTPNGFLMRLYRNMLSRITGVQKLKFHLYKDKAIISREEFYAWARSTDEFYNLFRAYEESGFERKLAPSVDRKDPSQGYVISNMEWVTHSENSRRGCLNRYKKPNENSPAGY